jgi:hypothetical protein
MQSLIDTRNADSVEREVQTAYLAMYSTADQALVGRLFGWAMDCFSGRYGGYQAVDARYHDLEHTLQGTLCLTKILWGRFRAKAQPVVTQDDFELGILAMLLHDAGYLKKQDDRQGTGAKYTLVHVERSTAFAEELLSSKGYHPASIKAVQNMIHCTGVNVDLPSIPFACEEERLVGFALGTADLLGQMAAPDYVDKLPILYAEFVESSRYQKGRFSLVGQFTSAEDLMVKTPAFWDHLVRPRIEQDFGGLYRFLSDPYPDGANPYLERIEANLDRLKHQQPKAPEKA